MNRPHIHMVMCQKVIVTMCSLLRRVKVNHTVWHTDIQYNILYLTTRTTSTTTTIIIIMFTILDIGDRRRRHHHIFEHPIRTKYIKRILTTTVVVVLYVVHISQYHIYQCGVKHTYAKLFFYQNKAYTVIEVIWVSDFYLYEFEKLLVL